MKILQTWLHFWGAIFAFACGTVSLEAAPQLQDLLRPITEKTAEEADRQTTPDKRPTATRAALTESEIIGILLDELTVQLDLSGELRIRPVRPLPIVFVHPGEWDIEVSAPPSLPGSRAFFEWTVYSQGKAVSRARHPFHVELWDEVWVARQRVRRGDSLSRPAIEPALRDVLAERNRPLDTSVELNELEAVTTILEGKPLTWRDVEVRPAVRRGDVIDVVLEQGSLSITMPAQATSDGKTGEVITLRNTQTRREIQAVITAPGRARVHLSGTPPNS